MILELLLFLYNYNFTSSGKTSNIICFVLYLPSVSLIEDEYRGQIEGTKRRDGEKKEKWERKGLHNLARDRSLMERLRVRKHTYTRFAKMYSCILSYRRFTYRVKYPKWLAIYAFRHFDFHTFVQFDYRLIKYNMK